MGVQHSGQVRPKSKMKEWAKFVGLFILPWCVGAMLPEFSVFWEAFLGAVLGCCVLGVVVALWVEHKQRERFFNSPCELYAEGDDH